MLPAFPVHRTRRCKAISLGVSHQTTGSTICGLCLRQFLAVVASELCPQSCLFTEQTMEFSSSFTGPALPSRILVGPTSWTLCKLWVVERMHDVEWFEVLCCRLDGSTHSRALLDMQARFSLIEKAESCPTETGHTLRLQPPTAAETADLNIKYYCHGTRCRAAQEHDKLTLAFQFFSKTFFSRGETAVEVLRKVRIVLGSKTDIVLIDDRVVWR